MERDAAFFTGMCRNHSGLPFTCGSSDIAGFKYPCTAGIFLALTIKRSPPPPIGKFHAVRKHTIIRTPAAKSCPLYSHLMRSGTFTETSRCHGHLSGRQRAQRLTREPGHETAVTSRSKNGTLVVERVAVRSKRSGA